MSVGVRRAAWEAVLLDDLVLIELVDETTWEARGASSVPRRHGGA